MRSHVHQIWGLSSFFTDPTIPEAFQFVNWHQPLQRLSRGSERLRIRKLGSPSTERRLRRILEQEFEDPARWLAENLADHSQPKIDASCHTATRRPISIDYISCIRGYRAKQAELLARIPVRCGLVPPEQTSCAEQERAVADTRDPGSTAAY